MVEHSVEFRPIEPCKCGRHSRIYRASGNCQVRFYAECASCGIRTHRVATALGAAEQWNAGKTMPIHYHAPASAVA